MLVRSFQRNVFGKAQKQVRAAHAARECAVRRHHLSENCHRRRADSINNCKSEQLKSPSSLHYQLPPTKGERCSQSSIPLHLQALAGPNDDVAKQLDRSRRKQHSRRFAIPVNG
jgi:hypothetical protein